MLLFGIPVSPDMPLYNWAGYNKAIFLWLNGFHVPWWDTAMWALTIAGSAPTFPYWMAAALILAWFRPGIMPPLNVVSLSAGFVTTGLLVPWIKAALDFPRPAAAIGRDLVTLVGPPAEGASFPSGHAVFVFLVAAALTPETPPAIKWLLWLFAILVGISRVAVGAHFPADVAGSAILGIAVAYLWRGFLVIARR